VSRANHEFLAQLFGDVMRGGETDAMRARLDRARKLLQKRYANEPVVYALLLLELAGRYDEAGLEDREEEVMKEFAATAEKTGDASLLATNECIQAFDLLQANDVEKARPHVQQGLVWMNRSNPPRTDAMFECLRADAMLATKTGDRQRAVARMQELLRRIESDGLVQTTLYTASLGSLAYVYALGGQFAEALDVSRKKTALDETLGSEATLGAYIERNRTSQLLFALGRISEAQAADAALFADFRSNATDGLPDFLYTFAEHALTANELNKAIDFGDSALAQFEKSKAVAGEVGSHRVLAEAMLRLGHVPDAKAEIAKANALVKSAPEAPRRVVNARRIDLALLEQSAAQAAVKAQLDLLRTALESIADPVQTDGATRLTVLKARLALGEGFLGVGDVETAAAFADASLALAQLAVLPGQTSAWVGAATLLKARVERAARHIERAQALATEAGKQFADTLSPSHPLRLDAEALATASGPASKNLGR
jgi:tetratricopeptide (TPR) repeat protein